MYLDGRGGEGREKENRIRYGGQDRREAQRDRRMNENMQLLWWGRLGEPLKCPRDLDD